MSGSLKVVDMQLDLNKPFGRMKKITTTKPLNQNKMKIEITHYGHKASYEFEHEDVTLDDLVYHLDKLLKLTGYTFDGELEIVNEEE